MKPYLKTKDFSVTGESFEFPGVKQSTAEHTGARGIHVMGCKWLPQVFGVKSDPGIT